MANASEHVHRGATCPARLRAVSPPPRRRSMAVALGVLATVVGVSGAQAVGGLFSTTGRAGPDPSAVEVVYVVSPGDTYWSIAASHHRGGDLRSTLDAVVDANGGRELRAGDVLVLPD